METKKSLLWNLIRYFITVIFLFICWMLFSATLDFPYVMIGLVGSLVISLFVFNVFIEPHEAGRRSVIPRLLPLLGYFPLLIRALYIASFKMLGAVLTGSIQPGIVHFKSRLRSDLARVVLAHSITFSPGTITMDLDEDHYVVHWMFASTRHSKQAGSEIKDALEIQLRKIWT
ncbi:Na+/H+ antiporter subunit E [Gracilinema caldarium]|uniref:Na+/H+ antiporter subunit E n=1 Tax=Gracilinema caldarium TaxID=215591 RepID=UPI0026E9AB76|nr:Na+/H+ antiporter subunit E [Gracilinema caldarium]